MSFQTVTYRLESGKKKSSLTKEKIATGGVSVNTYYKDHYKAAMEQLAAISLSDNTRTSQQYSNSTKQGSFDSWSHVCSQDNSSVSRM
nr:PREDICTED: protein FAM217A isoform X4 [Anolis carolinensis]|eukprot:XP_016850647.1 PREDICTED: protein FAM217A isoform X4 [Anolis carolinensis]